MTNYSFEKKDAGEFDVLKNEYVQQLAAPLDGMWEVFVAMADHYAVVRGDEIVGYCAINPDQKLLQFYVPEAQHPAHDNRPIFSQIINDLDVAGAVVSTGSPQYLSLCLDHQKTVQVHALMYRTGANAALKSATFPPQAEFRRIEEGELKTAVEFCVKAVATDPGWQKAYNARLIERSELFGLWQGEELIAIGECRVSDTQKPYADVGMIVAKSHRRQGLATNILRQLLQICRDRGLCAICSTERDNIAAQMAIESAGFVSEHRILEIAF